MAAIMDEPQKNRINRPRNHHQFLISYFSTKFEESNGAVMSFFALDDKCKSSEVTSLVPRHDCCFNVTTKPCDVAPNWLR
jgi:hypothetical protein